ncbi:MAG: hypothetical protein ACK46O_02380, partial [Flavobacteriia bacterium]
TYLFPVGKGGIYLPFTLQTTAASSPQVRVEAYNSSIGSPSTDATVSCVSTTEYWYAQLISGTLTANVSLGRQAALGTLDGIGRSTLQSGSFTSLGGTAASPNINTSSSTSSMGYFAMICKNCTAPTTQALNITAGSITGTSASINWTNGNGAGRVVYVNTTNSFTAPTNGSNPAANTTYTSGQQCVFNGTSGPVVVTGLIPGTTYWVRVYEYCSPQRNYQTASATNNPNSFTTQYTVPFTGNNSFSICSGTLYDHAGSAGNYLDNADGYTVLNPSVGGNFVQITGSITTEATYDFVQIYDGTGIAGTQLYSGSGTVANIGTFTSSTGPLTVRFYSDFSTVASGFALTISCVAPCTAPSTQALNITAGSITGTSASINWTNGNGAGRVVYVNTTNSFTAPTNGSNPAANTTYTGGQQCVFNGTSGPVVVTGLIPGTTYYVRIYEYCSPQRNYQIATNTNNPNSFTTLVAANDLCSGASTITIGAAPTSGTINNATAGSGACSGTANYDV